MNRFSLILLIGMLLMLWGVSGVSKLSETAISSGFDGSVVSNINARVNITHHRTVKTRANSCLRQLGHAADTPKH